MWSFLHLLRFFIDAVSLLSVVKGTFPILEMLENVQISLEIANFC